MTNNPLPGNPYTEELSRRGSIPSVSDLAVLALAWEQRQRNILAYRTATHRGIPLGGLDHLNTSDYQQGPF